MGVGSRLQRSSEVRIDKPKSKSKVADLKWQSHLSLIFYNHISTFPSLQVWYRHNEHRKKIPKIFYRRLYAQRDKRVIWHNRALRWQIKAILGANCTNTTQWTYLSHPEVQLGMTMAVIYFQGQYFYICTKGHDRRQTEIGMTGPYNGPPRRFWVLIALKYPPWPYLSCFKAQLGTTMAT